MKGLNPWIAGVLVAAAVVFLNDRFLFESIVVTSSSMEPTFQPNERVFLQRVAYGPIERFDVIVIKSTALGHRIVKRVVGLPGECVMLSESPFKEGLTKEGQSQAGWMITVGPKSANYSESSLSPDFRVEHWDEKEHLIQLRTHPLIHYDTLYGKSPFCLGPDEYYALGDNRLASGDSRYYGAFKASEVEGKLRFIWYSYDKLMSRLRTERMFSKVR